MKVYLSGPITGKAAAAADFEKLAQAARERSVSMMKIAWFRWRLLKHPRVGAMWRR